MFWRTFRFKLLLIVALISTAFALIGMYALVSYRNMMAEALTVEKSAAATMEQAFQVQSHFQSQELAWDNLLLRGQDPNQYHKYLSTFYEHERQTLALAQALLNKLEVNSEVFLTTQRFVDNLANIHRRYRDALRIYNQSAEAHFVTDQFLYATVHEPSIELANIVDMIRANQQLRLQQLNERVANKERTIAIVSLVVLMSAAAVLIWFLDRNFGRPISRAIDTAHDVATGKIDQRINIEKTDEFGVFANAFNHMLEKITFANALLEDKVLQLENEIAQRQTAEKDLLAKQTSLEAANQELESYSYSIAHDLRSPLRAIVGFSEVLLDDLAPTLRKEDKAHLNRIAQAGKHMADLIDDILELSRVTRQDIQLTHVNLSDIARESIERLRASQPDRSIVVDIDSNLHAKGDARLLSLLTDNLLGNAWKYTAKTTAPEIRFGRRKRNGVPVFFVSDNGVGFAQEFHDKLFIPFQRLHHRDDYEGTGVGLATVQRIVQRHHGRVWAEGQPNQGATFYFTLG